MISLKFEEGFAPQYMTKHSSACDLYAREPALIEPGQVKRIPVGVWISSVDWDSVPAGSIPELQVRARSSLSYKFNIMLANGIGTIDADYPDEIGVLLYNGGPAAFSVEKGSRIAQLTLGLVQRIPGISVGGKRTGGFGSTNSYS